MFISFGNVKNTVLYVITSYHRILSICYVNYKIVTKYNLNV